MDARVVDVAVPLPLHTTFSYRVPDGWPMPERGARVVVPVAGRRAVGVVTARGPAVSPEIQLKDVLDVVDEASLVEPPLLDLALWVSQHYLAPPGECFRLVLPPAGIRASRSMVRRVEGARGSPADERVLAALRDGPLPLSTLASRLGEGLAARVASLRRRGLVEVAQDLKTSGFRQVKVAVLRDEAAVTEAPAQAEALERLRAAGGRLRVAELVRGHSSLRSALARLEKRGVVSVEDERDVRQPSGLALKDDVRPDLLREQEEAAAAVTEALRRGGFAPFLLHGVTGSGKTEVYFRAADAALALGKGVLILVPEISLTPMLVRAASSRFGATVSVQHSELSAGERHDQWWRIREGEARVVIGARSAVFAPLPAAGLIVVDEEHEAAYKQEESPRYHARDVAVMRGTLEGAVVLLGSATPSVESHTNALKGKYRRLSLATRIGAHGLPRVEIVDRRALLRAGGDPILSPSLQAALEERLRRREQALLLLNRRGYATSLLCRECGQEAACPNCSVCLALHAHGRRALCHYCGHDVPAPAACAACQGVYLRLTGYGTEQVVEVVRAALPAARIARVDRDLAGRRGAVAAALVAFEAGETDILIGTQMIAKGHDFPRVTLVGVIDADVGLGLPDFRAAERTFQLLTQVAGRAGRADLAGEVILQSHWPDHYALTFACAQDYGAFYEREIEFRRTMAYPPVGALVNVVIRARDAMAGAKEADALGRRLREHAAGRYRVLGPGRAPLSRLRGEYRFQILLKGQRAPMREAVKRALDERYGSARWPGIAVDVDPVSVM
jgi:primosomal protein N' (replication factor Y) (superfamily II helicase)